MSTRSSTRSSKRKAKEMSENKSLSADAKLLEQVRAKKNRRGDARRSSVRAKKNDEDALSSEESASKSDEGEDSTKQRKSPRRNNKSLLLLQRLQDDDDDKNGSKNLSEDEVSGVHDEDEDSEQDDDGRSGGAQVRRERSVSAASADHKEQSSSTNGGKDKKKKAQGSVIDVSVTSGASADPVYSDDTQQWGYVHTTFFDHQTELSKDDNSFWAPTYSEEFLDAVQAYLTETLQHIMPHTFASDAESFYQCATNVIDTQIMCINRARLNRHISEATSKDLADVVEFVLREAMCAFVASPVCYLIHEVHEFNDRLIDFVVEGMKEKASTKDSKKRRAQQMCNIDKFLQVVKTAKFMEKLLIEVDNRANRRMQKMKYLKYDDYVDFVVTAVERLYQEFLDTGKASSQVYTLLQDLIAKVAQRTVTQTLSYALDRASA